MENKSVEFVVFIPGVILDVCIVVLRQLYTGLCFKRQINVAIHSFIHSVMNMNVTLVKHRSENQCS